MVVVVMGKCIFSLRIIIFADCLCSCEVAYLIVWGRISVVASFGSNRASVGRGLKKVNVKKDGMSNLC